MATVKLALAELTNEEKVQLATNIASKMTGNATFPLPNPTLASLLASAQALTGKVTQAADLRQQAVVATLEQDAAEDALDSVLTQLGAHADNASAGNEAAILSSGMAIKGAAAPVGALPAPGPVAVTLGDLPDEVDLSWPRLTGAKSFVIQYASALDIPLPSKLTGTTVQQTSVTSSKHSLTHPPLHRRHHQRSQRQRLKLPPQPACSIRSPIQQKTS